MPVEMKTADLVGPALDWAVAKAEGLDVSVASCTPPGCKTRHYAYVKSPYKPSRDWAQGGPLIEKYKLDVGAPMESINGPWNANTEWGHPLGQKGDTPLIAACRAIVAAKLGDTVQIPDELAS